MDSIVRPRVSSLFGLVAAALAAVAPGLHERFTPRAGRNDRKAQRAGEIAPAGTYTKRWGNKGWSKRDLHRQRVAAAKAVAPGPKFPPDNGKRRWRGKVTFGSHHRLVIPR